MCRKVSSSRNTKKKKKEKSDRKFLSQENYTKKNFLMSNQSQDIKLLRKIRGKRAVVLLHFVFHQSRREEKKNMKKIGNFVRELQNSSPSIFSFFFTSMSLGERKKETLKEMKEEEKDEDEDEGKEEEKGGEEITNMDVQINSGLFRIAFLPHPSTYLLSPIFYLPSSILEAWIYMCVADKV